MAYADQKMSGNKVTAIIIVALIHVAAIYALVTGLAFEAYTKVVEKVTTVNIEKEPEPPPPPPPPPKEEVPVVQPPVAPPVKLNVAPNPPQIDTVRVAPPPSPVIVIPTITAPPPPPAPPAPVGATSGAQPRGRPGDWATTDDYPARALREERQGTTGFRVSIGTDGRVTDCQVTSSSGSPDLDQATCTNVTRRARFKPALQNGTPVTASYSNRITWRIPTN